MKNKLFLVALFKLIIFDFCNGQKYMIEGTKKGEYYSKFHNTEFFRSIDVDWIEFDSVSFRESIFHFPVNVTNSRFLDYTDFVESKYDSIVSFKRTEFKGWANFFSAKFNSKVDFRETKFRSDATFSSVVFNSSCNWFWTDFYDFTSFSGVKFRGYQNFHETDFYDYTTFSDARFYDDAFFYGSNFDSTSSFFRTKFYSNANFEYVDFEQGVNFGLTIFSSKVNFERAEFNNTASFRSSNINEANFVGVQLPDTLDFENAIFNNEIDLTRCYKKQNGFCYLNLVNCDLDKLKLRYDKFRLVIPDSISEENYENLTYVYEGLLKNFRDNGFLTSYETLDKEYRRFIYLKNPKASIWNYFLNFVNDKWDDYGYKKYRIWVITFVLFTIFAIINWLRFSHLINSVYILEPIQIAYNSKVQKTKFHKENNKMPYWNIYEPLMAIYYTAIVFFGLKMSIEKLDFRHPTWVTFLFLQYLVGLICLAYLVNFVITSNLN